MKIAVKNLKGEQFSISCSQDSTVADLKRTIHSLLNCETGLLRLIHAGRQLEDHRTVSELGLASSDHLLLVLLKVL